MKAKAEQKWQRRKLGREGNWTGSHIVRRYIAVPDSQGRLFVRRVPWEVSMCCTDGTVIAPGGTPPTSVDAPTFCCNNAHVNEGLHNATARELRITPEGTIKPCVGCLMTKGSKN